MTSKMKILLVGNSPILQFYTAVLQLSLDKKNSNKNNADVANFELFHISDLKSNVFRMNTLEYGTVSYKINNHFTSLDNLIEAINIGIDNREKFKFDIVIIAPNSLKELHDIPIKLEKLVDEKTILLLESTGYLNLEQFVYTTNNKNSTVIFNINNVFSILTSHEIREINDNVYEEFANNNSKNNYNKSIYLGQVIANDETDSAMNYFNSSLENLQILTNFFKEHFNMSTISNCNLNKLGFNSKQWNIAIANICLNPLLVVFEEDDIARFPRQILINSLISGLISELLFIAKRSCNNQLFNIIEKNEQKIMSNWKERYFVDKKSTEKQSSNIPSLMYHFVNNRYNMLNFELLFVKPILLADEFSINTPYLESLYSITTQINLINTDNSKYLVRREQLNKLINEKNLRNHENNNFEDKVILLNNKEKNLKERNFELSKQEIQLNERDKIYNERENKLNEREIQLGKKETILNNLQNQINERQHQLNEKEANFQKKMANTFQQFPPTLQQPGSIVKSNSNNNINADTSFNSSFNTTNTTNHSISNNNTPLSVSTNRFIDPISTGLSSPMDDNGLTMPYRSPNSTINHPVKPTSRKNRKNNVPQLGNASSLELNAMVDQNDNLLGNANVGSIPNFKNNNSNNINALNSIRNTSGLGLSIPQPINDAQFGNIRNSSRSVSSNAFSPLGSNINNRTNSLSNSPVPSARNANRNFSPVNGLSPLNNATGPLVSTPVRYEFNSIETANNNHTLPVTPVDKINQRLGSQEPHTIIQNPTLPSSTPTPPTPQDIMETEASEDVDRHTEKKSKKKFGFFKKKSRK